MQGIRKDFYRHYKYYHFYSICFGLGCGTALYRPFYGLVVPSVLGVFFTIVFEILGIISDLPAHTRRCKGPPYVRRDVYWGFCFALFVAILNLNSYHGKVTYFTAGMHMLLESSTSVVKCCALFQCTHCLMDVE
ncbi:uncharacterized protein LOC144395249 isoform X3 [Gasterosteus aculeatus]